MSLALRLRIFVFHPATRHWMAWKTFAPGSRHKSNFFSTRLPDIRIRRPEKNNALRAAYCRQMGYSRIIADIQAAAGKHMDKKRERRIFNQNIC